MNFFKRALKSSWSKKGRTILLCAVFSAILIFVLAGLTIQSAANKATEQAEKDAGATVTLSANRENGIQKPSDSSSSDSSDTTDTSDSSQSSPPTLTLTPVKISTAEKIAALDNVAAYSLETSAVANANSGIEAISTSSDASSNNSMGGPGGGGMSTGDFQISGVSSTALNSNFSDGTNTLTKGEGITEDDEGTNNVVIESSLAKANDLSVGDTFKIEDSDGENSYTVTIKGIYKSTESSSAMSFSDPANTIYSSYTFANTVSGNDSDTVDSVVYTLSDPAKKASFVKAAKKLVNTNKYSVSANDQAYQQTKQSLSSVTSFAQNIVILVAVAGVIILTLIIMLIIRERRYEIGVLLSMGESRVKIIFQFFTEIFITMVVALIIATFSGNIVGNLVGNQLLSQQSESATEQVSNNVGGDQQGGPGGGGGGMQNFSDSFSGSTEVDELEITVQPTQIAILAGLGLVISLLSIILSSVGILRLNPKKILIG